MTHKITRLVNKYLYNKPLLINQEELTSIMEYVNDRNNSFDLAVAKDLSRKIEDQELGEGDVGVIPVCGPLTYESTGWEALCGMSSYQGMVDMMRKAGKQGYKTVVLDVDSGGGEAYGCFSTAVEMRSIADKYGMNVIAYVDGMSASAAYGISVMADEIIVNPMAEVGSVGVVTQLTNTSKKDKEAGVERVYVYAGESKIPYDAEGNFSKDFIEDLQVKVDNLYDKFLNHVVSFRGLEKETVRSTQAKVFSAEKALELGFVDKIMERTEFAEYLADIQENGDKMALNSLNLSVKEEKEKMQLEELQKNLDAAVEEKETTLSQLATVQEQLSEMQKTNAELVAALEQQKELVAAAEKEKLDSKLSQRKSQLAQVVAEDRLDGIFEATKNLEDTAFDVVLSGYKATMSALENSEMMTEQGVEAEADLDADEMSGVMNLIKQRKAK